jgi:hypothetical protein
LASSLPPPQLSLRPLLVVVLRIVLKSFFLLLVLIFALFPGIADASRHIHGFSLGDLLLFSMHCLHLPVFLDALGDVLPSSLAKPPDFHLERCHTLDMTFRK